MDEAALILLAEHEVKGLIQYYFVLLSNDLNSSNFVPSNKKKNVFIRQK